MAEAAKVPVKTERKLSETAPAAPAWWPIESLRREIDHLFDDFGGVFWRSPRRLSTSPKATMPTRSPLSCREWTRRISAEEA
jgi:hypothetical protein